MAAVAARAMLLAVVLLGRERKGFSRDLLLLLLLVVVVVVVLLVVVPAAAVVW